MAFKLKITSIALLLLLLVLGFGLPNNAARDSVFFNGVSFMGNPRPVNNDAFNTLKDLNCNAITLMPFAYGQKSDAKLVFENLTWQWWGESAEGTEESIVMAKEDGFQVMLKPQIWLDRGSFTGHHTYASEEDWKSFEESYRAYIMIYARMSEKHNLPVFCIGTELCEFVRQRPKFWQSLIADVKAVYSGKLTYAANWDTYSECWFWKELDFIGVDAYFPLSEEQTPTVDELVVGWTPFVFEMQQFSRKTNKPIVFTEWGYRSIDYCARRPWESGRTEDINLNGQRNAYQAMYIALYSQPWFAGGFMWKWHPEHEDAGGTQNNRFTPQNKPAQSALGEIFSYRK
ncbi:MAG: glycoside hydrolase [Cryomorphaceae bacterium]|nr:glycoside hydrolase [Cryomorphaceae bacterium]